MENALIYCLFLWYRAAVAKGRSALVPTLGGAIAIAVLVVGLVRTREAADLIHDSMILTFACIGIAVVAIIAGPAFDLLYRTSPGAGAPKAR